MANPTSPGYDSGTVDNTAALRVMELCHRVNKRSLLNTSTGGQNIYLAIGNQGVSTTVGDKIPPGALAVDQRQTGYEPPTDAWYIISDAAGATFLFSQDVI